MMTKQAQVANAMRQLIAEGHWKIGQSVGNLWKLEAESEKLFGVKASWGTIRAAEQDLVEEGILSVIQQGMPTRVLAVPSRRNLDSTSTELRAVYAKLGAVYAELGDLIARA